MPEFWFINVLAAGGETIRRGRDDLSWSAATLLLADAAFLVATGFAVLDQALVPYRGSFLVAVAAAHFAVGGSFLHRFGERHLFGLLNLGSGIAALSMAVPVQLGADAVPVAWTAEAVSLAWLAARRRHPYSAIVSGILYVLAGSYLIFLYAGQEPVSDFLPMVDARGAALAFFLAGVAAGVWLVRDLGLRSALIAFGAVVATVCASFALAPPAAVFAMTVVAVVVASAWRWLPRIADRPILWQVEGLLPPRIGTAAAWRPRLTLVLPGSLAVIGYATLTALLLAFYGPTTTSTAGGIAFVHPAGAALAFALLGLATIAWLSPIDRTRDPLLVSGVLVAAAVCPAELQGSALAIVIALLAVLCAVATIAPGVEPRVYLWPSLALGLAAATFTFVEVAPPDLLVVHPTRVDPSVAIEQVAAVAFVAIYLTVLGVVLGRARWARWARFAAGLALVYLLSIAVVLAIGTQVGDSVPFAERQTQGQVALSVLWTVLGAIAFIQGLRANAAQLRQVGLGLLAVASAKVFIFDLSSLDVAYRVVSLMALGLLLLVSAWLWQRFQPRPTGATDPEASASDDGS